MVQESKAHKAEDDKRKELAEARNIADNAAYQVEKSVREAGDKVPADEKNAIDAKVQELRQVMTSEDTARIKSLTDALQQEYARVMQASAAQQSQAAARSHPAGSSQTPRSEGGDVVDGEFTEQK